MKQTKIVCSIGPSTWTEEGVKELELKGMNIARLNFSHDNQESHLKTVEKIRKVSGIPLMLDTKGPELRTGIVKNEEIVLEEGNEVIITSEDVLGTPEKIQIRYDKLERDIVVGDVILIADGKMELKVMEVGKNIVCEVIVGGILENTKNVNIPNKDIDLPALGEKDISDIKFAVKHNFNFIAASFIRSKEDVLQIRQLTKGTDIKIISKIEHTEALKNIEEIIEVSDGIMVARGDLGMQINQEDLPIVQKRIVRKCNEAGKMCIVATQMLDSMITNPRPTRAEITDVANAVLDGADGVMLSGETAKGKYPFKAVDTMRTICNKTEDNMINGNFVFGKVA